MKCSVWRRLSLALVLCLLWALPAGAAHPLDAAVTEVRDYLNRQGDPVARVLSHAIVEPELDKKLISSLQKEILGGEMEEVYDLSLAVLALSASGTDPRECGGINLVDSLCSAPALRNENARDLSMALLALRSGPFYAPSPAAPWDAQQLEAALLKQQREDGGFGQTPNALSDAQSTAMALLALVHMEGNEEVVARGFGYLKGALQSDGTFLSTSGEKESQALSWTILALCTAGENQDEHLSGQDWIRQGQTLTDTLFTFQNEDSGFSSLRGEKSSPEATLPALLALESMRGGGYVLNFSGVEISPYEVNPVKTYGTLILTTVGVLFIIFLMVPLSKILAKRIDRRGAQKEEASSLFKNE